jgi:hypothetical protein
MPIETIIVVACISVAFIGFGLVLRPLVPPMKHEG